MASIYLAWTRVAHLAFIAATAYAMAVVAFRVPGVSADPGAFRFALALHVELAVFIWLTSSMAAQWALSRSGVAARAAPGLAAAGTLLVAIAPLGGGAPVMADYFPWISGNGIFSAGIALFGAAALMAALSVLRAAPTATRTMSAWCLAASGLTLVSDLANGARDVYVLAWGVGHTLLFSHVSMMLWEWSTVAGHGRRIARGGALWLAVTAGALAVVPWLFTPGTREHLSLYTEAMRWLLWPPAAALLVAIAWHRHRTGRRLPVGLTISMSLFPAGLLLGTLIDGQTTLITAHYHAAIGAIAISRMAMTYLLHERIHHHVAARRRAGQLTTYGLGIMLLAAGLLVASGEDAPRKTSASESSVHGPAYKLGMSLSGMGGVLAMVGTLWLVGNLWRRPIACSTHASQGRAENRAMKCHAMASTARTAAASNQGIVQS